MTVKGLDRFRGHFSGYEDRYVLIGGAAMWLVLDEAGLDPRATRDLDIVLYIEALDSGFAERIWDFVKAGDYQAQEKSSGAKTFYRFGGPRVDDYPEMLELFSRKPDGMVLGDDAHLTPIPVAAEVSSLSAILLDDVYYHYLHESATELDGISLIDERCLIPMKARAWLDMVARRAEGGRADSKALRKHRNDVLRLYQLLEPESRIELPKTVARDLAAFLDQAGAEIGEDALRGLNIKGVTPGEVMAQIRMVFGLT